MRKKELEKMRAKSTADLEKKAAELSVEARKVKANMFAGKETNLKKSGLIKKDVAQILTILKLREMGIEKENVKAKTKKGDK